MEGFPGQRAGVKEEEGHAKEKSGEKEKPVNWKPFCLPHPHINWGVEAGSLPWLWEAPCSGSLKPALLAGMLYRPEFG